MKKNLQKGVNFLKKMINSFKKLDRPSKVAIVTLIATAIFFSNEYDSFGFSTLILGAYIFYKVYTGDISNKKINDIKNEAQNYINNTKESGSLSVIDVDFNLQKNEYAILENNTTLFETRSVRKYNGGGVRVRVMKGVSVGGFSGESESNLEWREIDHGTLILTNKRLLFIGNKKNRIIPLKKIFDTDVDGIDLVISHKEKKISFNQVNPIIWSFAINVLIDMFDEESTFVKNSQ